MEAGHVLTAQRRNMLGAGLVSNAQADKYVGGRAREYCLGGEIWWRQGMRALLRGSIKPIDHKKSDR